MYGSLYVELHISRVFRFPREAGKFGLFPAGNAGNAGNSKNCENQEILLGT